MSAAWLAALSTVLATAEAARGRDAETEPELREEVKVRARAAGPALAVPSPRASAPVVDEVIGSLELSRKDYEPAASRLPSGAPRGLYPEPPYLRLPAEGLRARYERWSFEVLSGAEVLWRLDGEGPVREPVAWDGTSGQDEKVVVRVGREYRYRFTARTASERLAAASETASFSSLSIGDLFGGQRLEVASSVLFAPGGGLALGAERYLDELAARMRRGALAEGDDYRLELHEREPNGPNAGRRAEALRRYLGRALLINPSRIKVETLAATTRGEVLACPLPAERGATIGQ